MMKNKESELVTKAKCNKSFCGISTILPPRNFDAEARLVYRNPLQYKVSADGRAN